MSSNYLFIVEGEKDEKTLFDRVLNAYGFNTIVNNEKMNVEGFGQFQECQYNLAKDNIVIIQGPRNRIHDLLSLFNSQTDSLERAFSFPYGFFSAIFLIYDVDHNDCNDIEEMYKKFPDESTGMLLLSSPSIEVIGDYRFDRQATTYKRIKEYKADLNKHYSEKFNKNVIEYISIHFNQLIIRFLKKNHDEFKDDNIMNHPSLIIDKINEMNQRVNCENKDNSYTIYRYFSTVVYVAIAQAKQLTREIDNYQTVLDFFERNMQVPNENNSSGI